MGYLVVVVDPLKLFKVLKKESKNKLYGQSVLAVIRVDRDGNTEGWGEAVNLRFYRGLFCMRAILTRARLLPLSENLPPPMHDEKTKEMKLYSRTRLYRRQRVRSSAFFSGDVTYRNSTIHSMVDFENSCSDKDTTVQKRNKCAA